MLTEVPRIYSLTNILGGSVGELPTIYLAMPLGAKSKSKGIWNSLMEKCERKLVNWKSQYLSLGERVTLINSVLDPLPTYIMSLYSIPCQCAEQTGCCQKKYPLARKL